MDYGSKCRLPQQQNIQIIGANARIMEDIMSLCLSNNVTNNHDSGVFTRLSDRVHIWLDRWQQRDELTHWSDRDLHDVG
ncbi:MAG: DUF1127 domain-containing protein, partial [Bradyrhizobium sp.]